MPFWPKYRLGQPEKQLFVLAKNIFIGSKYPKITLFNFEKNYTEGNAPAAYTTLVRFGWGLRVSRHGGGRRGRGGRSCLH